MKKPAKLWFFLFTILPVMATFEGAEHFAVSTFSIILMAVKHQLTAVTIATPIWDYLMGMLSILGGIAAKKVGEYLESQQKQ